jgi:hypothetical protein
MSLRAGLRTRFVHRGPAGHRAEVIEHEEFRAVQEALLAGDHPLEPSVEAGRRLAEQGVGLAEALDGLMIAYHRAAGTEPDFEVVRAMSESWAESSLSAVMPLTCEDPLTGFTGPEHLRSGLGELYRDAQVHGYGVQDTHGLLVVELTGTAASGADHELRMVSVADCLRSVFSGGEIVSRLGHKRAAVLVPRDERLTERLETVRSLLGRRRSEPGTRVWVERLPTLIEWAEAIVDELGQS